MTISNNPPPFEAHSLNIEELIAQAQDYLDGEPISTQGQADDVGRLLDMIRQARKAADEQRAAEKRPHDEAGKAVQALWKPILDRCDVATGVAKRALVPWLERLEAEQKAAAEKARQEAEEKRQAALVAEHEAQASHDLIAAERAEQARRDAERSERAANKADKAKPQASGGARAIGLRSTWTAEITDRRALLTHYMQTRPEELTEWLQSQADADVRAGFRVIPGVIAKEVRVAA